MTSNKKAVTPAPEPEPVLPKAPKKQSAQFGSSPVKWLRAYSPRVHGATSRLRLSPPATDGNYHPDYGFLNYGYEEDYIYGIDWMINHHGLRDHNRLDQVYSLHNAQRYVAAYAGVQDRDAEVVRLGLSWGITGAWTVPDGGLRQFRDQGFRGGNHWRWTREAEMAKFIKDGIMEGLLETVLAIASHYDRISRIYDNWNIVKEGIRGRGAEQEKRVLQAHVDGVIASTRIAKSNAQLAFIRLKRDLDAAFTGADTMAKVLAASAKFVSGSFGTDWFVKGFFQPHCNHIEYQAEAKYFAKATDELAVARLGIVNTPFSVSSLKPMLKRHPDVARLTSA